MTVRYFPAIVESGDAPGYSVFFPDLPGCASAGNTIEDAARNAELALALHLRGMAEDGIAVPSQRAIDEIKRSPKVREAARILVRAELPGRSVRLNISMDEGLVAAVDSASAREGLSRSAFLAAAARRMIGGG
ncbi:MAG: type II toxin-antitoxin system HicB family antitoxin [Alphaproteobacteria bacterium]|nr:type II toxin-antitoxin system HicB family antitoxin [Alphaproteobacteria bacterium]